MTPYVTPPVVASSGDVRVLKPTADGKIVHVPVDITNHGKDAADYRVTVRVYAGNDTSYFKTVTVDSGLLQPGGGTQSSYLVNDPYQIMVYDPQAKIVKVTRTPR
ncbi:hypothetical protein K7472_04615 [Streptomyces sp. PTM05]|uniref:CARDB domain-containing protein n=1 Tax=Streptantibioticus parmotrematis TaxID=2873249 RepID=A0ABS7QLR6_9ACTN|nr:hypothetical protein [Streptantibioticus parmotrematis]MBY8884128.1 hypothetical protein [Streptantibioticus parmotrematis]